MKAPLSNLFGLLCRPHLGPPIKPLPSPPSSPLVRPCSNTSAHCSDRARVDIKVVHRARASRGSLSTAGDAAGPGRPNRGRPRLSYAEEEAEGGAGGGEEEARWLCWVCGQANEQRARACAACDARKPAGAHVVAAGGRGSARKRAREGEDEDDGVDDDEAVGGGRGGGRRSTGAAAAAATPAWSKVRVICYG